MSIPDERLLDLLEGRLDAASEDALRAEIDQDRDAAERLRLMELAGDALRDTAEPDGTGLDALKMAIRAGTHEDVPSPAIADVKRRADNVTRRRSLPWSSMQIAACFSLLALGLIAGYWSGTSLGGRNATDTSGQPTWIVRVVDYHTLYARETVGSSKVSAEDIAALQQTFEDALQTRMHIPTLSSQALEFRRGQVLKFEQSPIIQLAYLPRRHGITGCTVPQANREIGQ